MSTTPLAEFNKLNKHVSIYRPHSSNQKNSQGSASPTPSLIVVCSWMGAAEKHIAKYTDGYKRLFPNASILLIKSTVTGPFRRSDISPAYELVGPFIAENSVPSSTDGDGGMMVLHTFSNGGVNNAVWLAERFPNSLPLDRLIIDSAPGRVEIGALSRAFSLSLPNQSLVRLLGPYVVYFIIAVVVLTLRILRIEDLISRLRRKLNDPALFSQSTPRWYFYSKADNMVRHEDVHEHAEDARQRGYKAVVEEVFESAPHCALLNEDADRYWAAVEAHILDRARLIR